jgi:hypothetical protein
MLGNVILPPLISGEGESTWRMIVSGCTAWDPASSGGGPTALSIFEDAKLFDRASKENQSKTVDTEVRESKRVGSDLNDS